MAGDSQEARILAFLRSGRTLTPAVAYELCGTLACHSRIAALRQQGHDIRCRVVSVRGRKFGEYTLHGQHPASTRPFDEPLGM